MVNDNLGSSRNTVTIFHQNICGLRRKTDELISTISPNFPHVLCFSEHHLKTFDLNHIDISGYKLGAAYSRQDLKGGGACIFVQNNLECTNIGLDKYCKEQDIEICVIKLTSILYNNNIIIMAVYRAPSGNFNLFLKRLDDILKLFYKVGSKIILCGDINVDYLIEDVKKRQLNELLLTYNLTPIVHFPTRTLGSSSTATDNIFLDTNTFFNYTVSPLYNGLADHDAQLLTINNLNLQLYSHCTHTTRSLNIYSIKDFKITLSYESWDGVFSHNESTNVDTLFNSFLNNYLRLFCTSFPSCKISVKSKNNSWITPDIRTSCKHKRFFLSSY
jgi:exonuclease III